MSPDDAHEELSRLRDAIDRVDEVLVKLLNQRARYAVEIGEIKSLLKLPIYVAEREKEVLRHVEAASAGPLSGNFTAIYEYDTDRGLVNQNAQDDSRVGGPGLFPVNPLLWASLTMNGKTIDFPVS